VIAPQAAVISAAVCDVVCTWNTKTVEMMSWIASANMRQNAAR